ncbi:MAG: PAS domain S-box protein [Chitinophagaceae bacterium]|jgi:PAS domain S-box-containing protein|nr:PAS domain S-box protein [Chitinophagaceae bacterium]
MNRTTLIPEIFQCSRLFYYSLIDYSGRFITCNDFFLELYKIKKCDFESRLFFDLIQPNDRRRLQKAMDWCYKHPGTSTFIEVIMLHPNQSTKQARWELITVVHSVTGEMCLQCTGYDLEEDINHPIAGTSKQPDLLMRHEMLETLLSNSIDVFLLTDKENIILYCTPNVTKVLGYHPQELIGRNGFEFVHPDDLETTIHAFKEEYDHPHENHSADIRFLKKDGSWLWAEAKGKNLFHLPHVNAMLINLNDISLRKKSEEALEESELRYKSLFQQLPLPSFVVSPDYKSIIDVNFSALEKYGYTRDEFLQLTVCSLFLEQITPDQMAAVYETGEAFHHKTRNGNIFSAVMQRRVIDYANMTCVMLVVTDVTEERRTQEEHQLGYDVSEILIQPNSLQQNLATAVKRIREFVKWDLAELWVPNFDEVLIRKKVTDYDEKHPDERLLKFLEASAELAFTINDFENVPSYKTLKPYWVEHLETGHSYQRRNLAVAHGFKSTLAVPVVSSGRVISFLILHSFQQRAFNKADANLLSVTANLIGAEMEKRKNDLVLEKFFSISNDILTISGLDGVFKRVNKAFENFIGYTQEEANKIDPISYVYEEDRVKVLEKLNEMSSGNSIPYFENRVVTKNGEIKWVAWTANVLLKEGMVIASHRDITAQKKAADEIKMSNDRYELIKKATNEAIWDYDLVTQTITRSNGYKVLFGYDTDQEHAGLLFWESKLHPADKESVIKQFHDFVVQKTIPQWQCSYRFQRADGSYAFVSDQGYLIFDQLQNPIRIVGSMQDITEENEFAEKLKISNERYELVTKATNEAIWDLDLTTHQLTWSEGYKLLFGHDFNDQENGLDFWADNIHPADRDRIVTDFDTFLLQHDNPHWTSEYRFKRKDGSYANVIDKGYLIFDLHQNPIRMVGSMQDITEQKKLEKEFYEREKNRQNQIAQAAVLAQEKERAEIGKELHDNVSQLLTTTKLYLEMLRLKIDDNPLDLIDRGTRHINTVIKEIRNLSRSLVPASIDDLGLVASLNDLIESYQALGSMDITFTAPPDLEYTMESSLKLTLYRIVQEQINNIVKHAKATDIRVEFTKQENIIQLAVSDNGKGFDINTIKKGMGLDNIKNRAELQNGTAEIISQPGKGCRLTIQIPINN